jgi:hypothetical protein
LFHPHQDLPKVEKHPKGSWHFCFVFSQVSHDFDCGNVVKKLMHFHSSLFLELTCLFSRIRISFDITILIYRQQAKIYLRHYGIFFFSFFLLDKC